MIIANRCIRFFGNLVKLLGYVFHFFFPSVRFSIPSYSPARFRRKGNSKIPACIWQTNYSSRCTLPVYVNYLFNRLMSLSFDYRYISTEERSEYLRIHADSEIFGAYSKLKDGAAQADLWRIVTMLEKGGVYMDIDAVLVWPLRSQLRHENEGLFIRREKDKEITNYFIASAPGNPVLHEVLDRVVANINHFDGSGNVYNTTGPAVFNSVLGTHDVTVCNRNLVCIQGAFTNEHFQYLDRPGSKWTRKKPKDIISVED